MRKYRGVLIEESLLTRACFDVLHVLKRNQVEIEEPAAGQPATWTLSDFEVSTADAGALAETLSRSLATGPWYVDFNDGRHTYVVFAGRVFAYDHGDDDTLEEARDYARSVGVPESQIDWAVPD